MQALRSVFTRTSTVQKVSIQTTAPKAPVELSLAQLRQVAGGLPRVGVQNIVVEPPLPRVG